MPIKVLELHHVGFGVNHAQADAMLDFYREVLNLPQDAARWKIPGIYGSWINLPNGSQLHILGSEGPSRYAQGPGKDPVSSPSLKQLFLRDPAGNLVELHQSSARAPGIAQAEQDAARAGNE
jgi:catechol 2,3-dioxygenase-like lactoylglutathione lyase family enzyme